MNEANSLKIASHLYAVMGEMMSTEGKLPRSAMLDLRKVLEETIPDIPAKEDRSATFTYTTTKTYASEAIYAFKVLISAIKEEVPLWGINDRLSSAVRKAELEIKRLESGK